MISSPQLSVSGLYSASPDPCTPGQAIELFFKLAIERR